MNNTRLVVVWLLALLGLHFVFDGAQSGLAQNQLGWGEIWKQRMTIGQAQLDDAFKLAESGKLNEALAAIDRVIAADPSNWRSYFLKSAVLVLAKRGDEALKQIDTSIDLARKSNVSPGLLAELYASKARSCIDYGRADEAKRSLGQAAHLQPNDPSILNDLAWLLATSRDSRIRDGRRAVTLAQRACKLSQWKNAFSIDTLAAASASAGNFPDAVKYQQLAISRLDPADRKTQEGGMEQRLQQYSSGRAFTSI
jgi:tetratricopeptide (TPR) repeat protein